MQIKKIRTYTGLTQIEFARRYGIPLQTLKQWESASSSSSFRKPPEYVVNMLNRLVEQDFRHKAARFSDVKTSEAFLITGAKQSRYHAKQWLRYLRKEVMVSEPETPTVKLEQIMNDPQLTMFQRISLKRAMTSGSATNEYIKGLSDPAKATMLEEIIRKHTNDLEYIAGMKFQSARGQDIEDIGAIIKKLQIRTPDDLVSIMQKYGFGDVDESLLLEAFGYAYGMDWLEKYYIENEEEIIKKVKQS